MGVDVFIVGSGGREHALAWGLSRSAKIGRLAVAPGNGGTSALAENIAVSDSDIAGLVDAAIVWKADFVVVGPEVPLAAGLVDLLRDREILTFGPTHAAAQIEASKSFAKSVMQAAGVPTARWQAFDDFYHARAYLAEVGAPVVIKADGLAAGKGVVVADTLDQATQALESIMLHRVYGESGGRVVIEEKLTGPEVSLLALVDGHHVTPLPAACDYKPIGDGDTGPNTGGMGCYCPPPWFDGEQSAKAVETIIKPVVAELARRGAPFSGLLYTGLMVTADGPKVIEFNSRFGDPETEAIIPLLNVDLLELLLATATGRLDTIAAPLVTGKSVDVVLASAGYPGVVRAGVEITGLAEAAKYAQVFHAGTKEVGGKIFSAGGRVLNVVGTGATFGEAREAAYRAANAISFEGMQFRRDIGLREAQS